MPNETDIFNDVLLSIKQSTERNWVETSYTGRVSEKKETRWSGHYSSKAAVKAINWKWFIRIRT